MNIAYFSNQFAQEAGHGIARYARHLFAAMRELEPEKNIVPVAAWSDRNSDSLNALKQESGLRILPWGRKFTPLAWTYFGFPKLESWVKNVDLVHAVSLGYPIATRKPFVVTVHDIGPLTHPQYFSAAPPWIMKRALQQAIRDAKTFICVSHATAHELVAYVKQEYRKDLTDRVEVVHEGVERRFFEVPNSGTLDSLELPTAPFLMTAGAISPRKNLQGVIQALGEAKDLIPHHLLAVGGKGWDSESIIQAIETAGLTDRVHLLGYVSDEQLLALYHRASVYLHPSLFEGFGLTVLEAMAAGCPVITSNVFSLPEVAGDAAELVDPHSIKEITDAILKICQSESVANEMKEKGVKWAGTFQWEKAAQSVIDIYERAV